MRKSFILPALVVVASTAALLAQAPGAGKVDTQWKCAPATTTNAIPVPDAANHAYVIDQTKCTATKGEIGGIKEKEGTPTEFMEAMGDNAKGHGVFVATSANGDKITYTYTFTGVSKNSVMQTGSNKWTMDGGTGKFKGIKGTGTCAAKGNSDGSAVYDCTGTYTLGK